MADLLFEIGAEEIPAGFVPSALKQLEEDLAKALSELRLGHGEVKAVGTPRRLAVWARDLFPKQTDARTEALGPPSSAAFDASGQPTQAALGFARSQGVLPSALLRVATPKGERVAVVKVEKGRRAEQVLPGLLERLVSGIRFKKAMRSRYDEVTFARPIRWMVALYGGKPLKVHYGEVTSGKVTFGHRFVAPRPILLTGTPEDYLRKLRAAKVLVDPAERRAAVVDGLNKAAAKSGGKIRADEALLEQVTYLVEYPTAIPGEFEKSNLDLPAEVVVSEMRNHQRYFAVVDANGLLKNHFVAVSGTPVKKPAVARHGYEGTLRARLADARFFFDEDRKRALKDRIADLGRRTYQARLGSELERTNRISAISAALARALGMNEILEDLQLASQLAKTDLGTGMVGEFPELQGIMGAYYARLEGLPAAVAEAIEDHYRPVGAAGELPRGDLGALIGLSDRLHQLVGIIGVGEKATGAADPFGLRRAAIGVLRILLDRGYHLSLRSAVLATLDSLAGVRLSLDRAVVAEQVVEFVKGRARAAWTESFDADLVEAVLSAGFDDVVDAHRRLTALAGVKARPDFLLLAVAFKRVANIQEKAGSTGTDRVDPSLLSDEAERNLLAEVERVEASTAGVRSARNYVDMLAQVATLEPSVARFFAEVLVMADDPLVRANRLGLMRRVASLFDGLADFKKIQAEPPPRA